jgi:ABC-type multidrug transport system permease subunit
LVYLYGRHGKEVLLIKMTTEYLYNIPNATSGLDAIGIQLITSVPGFIPMLLLFVFVVVALGGITRQIARNGTADYPMWFTVASLSSFFVALLLSVSSGFISLDWLVISLVITIFCSVWFFLDQKQSEV